MFCPKCGARNVEGAKYCRACGADISLVPQALAHALADDAPPAKEGRERRHGESPKEPTLERGLSKIFTGLAFLLIVLLGFFYFRGGVFFWVWFIIPALANFGEGLGIMIRAGQRRDALPPRAPTGVEEALFAPATLPRELAPRPTAEMLSPPASVIEGTTRHLDAASDAARAGGKALPQA